MVKQKTREEIRIEEEKRLAELKLAEEKRLLEEKKKRIATEAAKTVNIETFNPDLYQSISGDINSGCRLFLSNLVKENFSTPLSFECSVVMTWSPEAIPGFTMAYGNGPEWVKAFSADNVTPFLYYQPKYSIAETAVPIRQLLVYIKIFTGSPHSLCETCRQINDFRKTRSASYDRFCSVLSETP